MAHAENEVEVPRPPAAVWAFLADLDTVPTWISAVRGVELTSGEAGAPGSEYRAAVEVGSQQRTGTLRLVEVEAPSRLSLRISASPLRIDGVVTVAAQGAGSLVRVVLDAPTSGLLRLLDGQIQQGLDDALSRLPRLADAVP